MPPVRRPRLPRPACPSDQRAPRAGARPSAGSRPPAPAARQADRSVGHARGLLAGREPAAPPSGHRERRPGRLPRAPAASGVAPRRLRPRPAGRPALHPGRAPRPQPTLPRGTRTQASVLEPDLARGQEARRRPAPGCHPSGPPPAGRASVLVRARRHRPGRPHRLALGRPARRSRAPSPRETSGGPGQMRPRRCPPGCGRRPAGSSRPAPTGGRGSAAVEARPRRHGRRTRRGTRRPRPRLPEPPSPPPLPERKPRRPPRSAGCCVASPASWAADGCPRSLRPMRPARSRRAGARPCRVVRATHGARGRPAASTRGSGEGSRAWRGPVRGDGAPGERARFVHQAGDVRDSRPAVPRTRPGARARVPNSTGTSGCGAAGARGAHHGGIGRPAAPVEAALRGRAERRRG